MTNETVFVRLPDTQRLLEWEPSSSDAPLLELYQLLGSEYKGALATDMDLVDENTGQPVDPATTVSCLSHRVLVANEGYIARAKKQLQDFQNQAGSLFSYEFMPHSVTARLELYTPGLVERPDHAGSSIYLHGKHEMLMVLSRSFPQKPPTFMWLTPVFHPVLSAGEPAWPPDFKWDQAPSLSMVLDAFIKTLVGMRAGTRRSFNIARSRPANLDAFNWYRKHRRALAGFAATWGYPVEKKFGSLPLLQPDSEWQAEGCLEGGNPLVFLSQRFMPSLAEVTRYSHGWIIGERGQWGESEWIYGDRMVPCHKGDVFPEAAVGFVRRAGAKHEPQWRHNQDPLIVETRNGKHGFKIGRNSYDLPTHFTKSNGRSVSSSNGSAASLSTDSAPQNEVPRVPGNSVNGTITIGGPTYKPGANGTAKSGELTTRQLEPLVCIYCSKVSSDGQIGSCSSCGSLVHAHCYSHLGGCPSVSCAKSPLYIQRTG